MQARLHKKLTQAQHAHRSRSRAIAQHAHKKLIQSLRLCPRRGDRTVHERGAAHETPTRLLAGGDAHDAAEEESKLVKEEEAESERK